MKEKTARELIEAINKLCALLEVKNKTPAEIEADGIAEHEQKAVDSYLGKQADYYGITALLNW